MNLTLLMVVLGLYFLLMIAISFVGRRYAKTYDSYLNIGRNAGILLIMGGAIGGHIGNGFVVGGAGSGADGYWRHMVWNRLCSFLCGTFIHD